MTAPKRLPAKKTTKTTKPKKATAMTKTPSLRERAERLLPRQKERLDELSTTDLKKLVHELGTHQIELEMQNEELHRMQAELEESRNNYADLYDFAPIGYCTVDRNGLIQEINLTAAKLLGIERQSLIGKPFSTYVEKDARDAYRLHRTAVLESRAKQAVEIRLKGKGAAGFYALLESVAVEDAAGKAVAIRSAVSDISIRKQAEEALEKTNEILELRVAERTAALRDSEERLMLAHQAAKIGAFEWNVQTGVNLWTPELEAMYGLPRGEFGKTQPAWEQLVHPKDRAAALGMVSEAFESGEPVEGEWRVVWRDGSEHWITGRFQAFKDASGKPLRLSGVNMDITERKRAEEALRQSEEKYRTLFTSVSEGFTLNQVLYDESGKLYDLRVLEANPAAERANGLTRDNFVGKTWRELWPGAEDYWWDICNKVMLNNEEARFENYTRVHDRWYEVHHFKAGTDLMGSIFTDVTGRKKSDEALRQSESRFRSLFETMAEGFSLNEIILDEAGKPVDLRYLLVNPAFERHTGLKAGDIIGRTTRELFPDAEPIWFEWFGKVALTGEPMHVEERFGPLNKWFEVSVYRTEPRRLAAVFFDITERKQAEETVKQHLEEMKNLNEDLERFNRVAVDRELRMIALKKEINELSVKAGMQPPYALDFEHKE